MTLSWRGKRRVTYLSVLTGAIILVFLPTAYFLYPKASCTDLKQNGSEEGVDCGGKCENMCKATPKDILVEWVRAFSLSAGAGSAVAYVTNPNRDLYAEGVPYQFKLYNSSNILIAERRGKTSIFPGASFPVFSGAIGVSSEVPSRASFALISEPKWQSAKLPGLKVNNQIFEASPPRLSADIRNTGVARLKNIVVTAVLFDQSDNAYAASETILEELPGGGEGKVIFTWGSLPIPPARVLIYPKPSPLK